MDLASVHIWGELVGAVAWNEITGLATFEYDTDFKRRNLDLSPLKMSVNADQQIFEFPELRKRSDSSFDTFKGLPGLLADSLPDRYGNELINKWLAQQGRRVDSMNLVDFAQRILSQREKFHAELQQEEEKAMMEILKIGTSAGGARPKAVIAYNEKTGEVKSGQTSAPKGFEHWLIKLDGVSDVQLGVSKGYGRVEMAYYNMAKDCGIEMMPSRLIEENGRAHFMTKRFDREGSSTKHHIQTFCALKHFDYNEVTSYSYEQLFQTMRELKLTYPMAEQMFRRMVFNVLARNCDDHTKNFSFRKKKGNNWDLAPAYDVCHAYSPNHKWVSQHALSINGKRDHISKEDLLLIGKSIKSNNAKAIIQEISESVSQWKKFANEVNVLPFIRDEIAKTLIFLY